MFREDIRANFAQDKAREEQEPGRKAAAGTAGGASGETEYNVLRAIVNIPDAYAAKAQPLDMFC